MIELPQYRDKKVAVFGLGKAGKAATVSMLSSGAITYCWDDRFCGNDAKVENFVTHVSQYGNRNNIICTDYTEWDWKEISLLILSPGVPLTHPKPHNIVELAKNASCPIVGEVEMLYRATMAAGSSAKFVGITGTNGKSTTTALVGHILNICGYETQIGGNLGTPALSFEMLGDNGIYVIEMSSYQLDIIDKTRFNVAALINITPDHIDRHGSIEGYIEAKKRIFNNQTPEDTAIVAIDDDYCMKIAEEMQKCGYQHEKGGESNDSSNKKLLKKISVNMAAPSLRQAVSVCNSLRGKHNLQNALIAYEICKSLGLKDKEILSAISSFEGLPHRMEHICEKNGIKFINDSKATNADSAAKALDSFDNIYWIVGGIAKAGGIDSLKKYFPKIRHAFIIGQDAKTFAKSFDCYAEESGASVPYTMCESLEDATSRAIYSVGNDSNSVILLSPAAASFDQFANFEERGKEFCRIVNNILRMT